eukprot:TRINITY_DN47066_c0_g1_i1.p1 TRINITY_DN47066_c0_g1~~TRINITY_DN47066_c0_g1_i1.p1  ORF type:complete len:182 (+),score=48.77 TRINITY_DN47066_c0_g1_i1:58-603(+)
MGGALGGPSSPAREPSLVSDPIQGAELTWRWRREPGGLCCLPDTCTIREACGGAPPRDLIEIGRVLRDARLQQELPEGVDGDDRKVLESLRGRRLSCSPMDGGWGYWRTEEFDDTPADDPPTVEWHWVHVNLVPNRFTGEEDDAVDALFRLRKEAFKRRPSVDWVGIPTPDGPKLLKLPLP